MVPAERASVARFKVHRFLDRIMANSRFPLVALVLGLLSRGLPAPLPAQAPGAPAPPLTLREVYALAAEHNPTLQASAAATRAARAMESSAALPPDPQLQIGVMNASLPGLRTDMPNSMAPSIQVMQMVPTPGKLALAGRIARQGTAIARSDADERGWEVRARAAMAFYEVYSADRQLAVMHETLALLRSYEQVTRSMYAAGTGRQSDVLRAGVEVARMEADVTRMAAMRTAAVARLNAVLARPADTPVVAVEDAPGPVPLPSLDTLRAWAEQSRPMLAGSRLGVERAAARASLARREILPDLTVGVQYGQRSGEMGTERMGSLMLGASVPVFAGRRQIAMRREAEAMQQMSAAELVDARAQVDARIGELAAELDRARSLVQLYRGDVLPQARANVTSTLSAYRVGSVDFMALVDAQMSLNRYQQELIGFLAESATTMAEMEMTLGRELPQSTIHPTGTR